MTISNDVYANILHSLKCIFELEDKRKYTADIIFKTIEKINNLSEMYEYYEEFNYLERTNLKNEMKMNGKIFIEETYKLFNILHRIKELKKRINNVL